MIEIVCSILIGLILLLMAHGMFLKNRANAIYKQLNLMLIDPKGEECSYRINWFAFLSPNKNDVVFNMKLYDKDTRLIEGVSKDVERLRQQMYPQGIRFGVNYLQITNYKKKEQ